jgi:hypothetical protein
MIKKKLAKSKNSSRQSLGEPILLRTGSHQSPVRSIAGPKLAKDGDPLVMIDGRVIQPEEMFPQTKPPEPDRKVYRPLRKRAIRELPAAPNVMKGVAVVFGFTVLGLTDRDIAEILGVTVTQVREIRAHAAYNETFNIISSEFVSAKSKRLDSRIAAMADNALDTVGEIMTTGKENNRLRASIDVLDRAGAGQKETRQNNMQQNELRITITKGDSANVEVNGLVIDQ